MDAKNYTAGFRSKMVNSIIISYIGSLHAEEGMIFFPDYPENEFMEHMANPETDSRGYTRLRCSPSDKPELIEMRNKSLQYIFDQITKSNQIKLSI